MTVSGMSILNGLIVDMAVEYDKFASLGLIISDYESLLGI